MQNCVRELITSNKKTSLLLIDIGVWPFRDLLNNYPNRVKNIGIFEPGTISIAAGLSLQGVTPTVYGISPFIVERSLEQLKLDFVYQKTGGNFITTGGSYEFSTLGYSHYCPEDISILYQLPGMDILTPATPCQFETLWKACALNGRPSYFRMTDYSCHRDVPVEYGKANVIKTGTKATVICAAEIFDDVYNACSELDVNLLFYSTIQPFDINALLDHFNEKIIVCEPFFEGTLAQIITEKLQGKRVAIKSIGIPREVIRNYGNKLEKDSYYGLQAATLKNSILDFIRGRYKGD